MYGFYNNSMKYDTIEIYTFIVSRFMKAAIYSNIHNFKERNQSKANKHQKKTFLLPFPPNDYILS